MRKVIHILTFLLCCGNAVNAQILDVTKYAVSPNMASMQQSTDIPISYYTGTPTIEIPLFEMDINDHPFPISISYHPAGIRPEQRPGWLGVGWNLNIGGQITRNINGLIDEGKLKWTSMKEYDDSAYMYHYSDLASNDWYKESFILSTLKSREHYETLQNNYDLEPDEFNFNFLEYNGSFYLNHQGKWVVKCATHLVVDSVTLDEVPLKLGNTHFALTHSLMISGFRITAEDGTRYYFGYDPLSVELTGQFFEQQNTHWNATSWQLTKIEYTNNETVILNYERGELTNQMWCNILNYKISQGNKSLGCSNSCEEDSSYLMSGSLTSPVFLAEVKFPLGTIQINSNEVYQLPYEPSKYYTWRKLNYSSKYNFGLLPVNTRYPLYQSFYYFLIYGVRTDDQPIDLYNNEKYYERLNKSRILNSIKVYDNKNELISNISFNYYNRGDKDHRPFLKTVSNPFKWIGSYGFEYKNMYEMPRYLSGQIDHWGYYNGSYLSYRNSAGEDYFNSREPNPQTCDCGIIQKIIYPTGGYSRFEFEPNDCSAYLNNNRTHVNQLNANRLAGGNRIRRIYHSSTGDSTDEVLDRELIYKKDFVSTKGESKLSSGVLGGLPAYSYSNYLVRSYVDTSVKGTLDVRCSSNSVFSGGNNSQGSQIGYSEVVEKFHDGSFNLYKYTNFDNNHSEFFDEEPLATFYGARTAFAKYSSREQNRGLLIEKSYYGSDSCLIRKEENQYDFVYNSNNYVRALHWNILPLCDTEFPIAEASSYKFYLDVPKLTSAVVTDYSDGDTASTARHFIYNKYNQVYLETQQADAFNDIYIGYTYLWESDTTGNCEKYNIISPMETLTKRQYGVQAGYNQIDKKRYCYSFSNNGRLCLPTKEVRYYTSSQPVDTCLAAYNSKGRLISLVDGGQEKVLLWGYSNQYLVAEIENSSLSEVKAAIPYLEQEPQSPVLDTNAVNTLRQKLPNAYITTYAYKPLVGMVAKTLPSGITEYYKYNTVHKGWLDSVFDTEGQPVKVFNYFKPAF